MGRNPKNERLKSPNHPSSELLGLGSVEKTTLTGWMMNGAGFAMVCCNPHWGCLPFFHCYPHASWDGHIYKVIFARSCGLSVKKSKKGYNVRACGYGELMMVHMTAISAMSGRVLEDCFCMALRWLKSNWWLKSNLYLSLALVKFLAAPVPVLGTMGRKRRNFDTADDELLLLEHNRDVGLIDPRSCNLTGPSFIEYEVMYVRDQILFVWSDCQRAWEDVRTSFDEIHGQLDKPLQFNSSPLKKMIIPKRTGLFSNHHFAEAIC